jgi:hypothetical protein
MARFEIGGRLEGRARLTLSATTLTVVALSLLMLIVGPTVSEAQSNRTSRATFSYTCCRTSLTGTVYKPGQTIDVRWISKSNGPREEPVVTIVLKASITGPYRSIESLKSSTARLRPILGTVNASAVPIRISNLSRANPLSRISIPKRASSGYYELTDTVSQGSVKSSGGVILRVTR